MALKLRRQADVITNENLSHLRSTRQPEPLRTGAGSFKRVLGSAHTGNSARLTVSVREAPRGARLVEDEPR